MATAAQCSANRENARKSTGPRTGQGKHIASSNALKHGLAGRIRFLNDDEALNYIALGERLIREMEPVTLIEEGFVKTIQDCTFQIERYRAIEEQIHQDLLAELDPETEADQPVDVLDARAVRKDFEGPGALEKLARYATRFQRDLLSALREFTKQKAARLAVNRAAAINDYEQETRRPFSRHDRVATPTGFELQKCVYHLQLQLLKAFILRKDEPKEPIAPETAPEPVPIAA